MAQNTENQNTQNDNPSTPKKENIVEAASKRAAGKFVLKVVAIAIAVCGIAFGVWYFLQNYHTGIRIMNTPTVVQEIKKISELATAVYVEDIVIQDTIVKQREVSKVNVTGIFSDEGIIQKGSATDKILFVQIATGRIRAGFDLRKVEEKDIVISDSDLTITLPQAEILDVIMNPSDVKPFYDEKSGSWTEAEIHEVKTQMLDKELDRMKANAIDAGILKRAEQEGIKKLKAMFNSFGFNNVNIIVKEPVAE